MSHYSHSEFLLGDFVVKCQFLEEYRNKDFKFPYRLENKLSAVRQIAEGEGPISKYKQRICKLIGDILKFEEMRHFMAHGFMMLNYSKIHHEVELILYAQIKDQSLKLEFSNFNIVQMRGLSDALSDFLAAMIDLFREIYIAEKLKRSV